MKLNRMMSRAVVTATLAACCAVTAWAAGVGETVSVRNDVKGTPPGGAARAMAVGDGIVLGHAIVSGQASAIKMTFDPQGSLSLGPSTNLTIEQSVVDRATGRSTSKLSLLIGSARVALGALFGGEVEVETPSAVVGIKGTDVIITHDRSGLTTIIVLEGTVEAHGKPAGSTTPISGQTFATFGPGATGGAAPLDQKTRGILDAALDGFGSPAPGQGPLSRDQMAALANNAFGPTAGTGAGSTGLVAELGTLSPAAGGASFFDPQLTAFVVPPVQGTRKPCNPQTGACP